MVYDLLLFAALIQHDHLAMKQTRKASSMRVLLNFVCVVLMGFGATSAIAATVYELETIGDGFTTILDGATNGNDRLTFTLIPTSSAPAYEITFEGTIGSAGPPRLLGPDQRTQLATLSNGNPFTLTLTPSAAPAGTDYLFFFGSFFGGDTVRLSVAAVPLPAAAWLFISALGGLVGIKRLTRIQNQKHIHAAA